MHVCQPRAIVWSLPLTSGFVEIRKYSVASRESVSRSSRSLIEWINSPVDCFLAYISRVKHRDGIPSARGKGRQQQRDATSGNLVEKVKGQQSEVRTYIAYVLFVCEREREKERLLPRATTILRWRRQRMGSGVFVPALLLHPSPSRSVSFWQVHAVRTYYARLASIGIASRAPFIRR